MTLRGALLIALMSWVAFLGTLGYLIWSGSQADERIRNGAADAAKLGCQENNERWQSLVDFSFAKHPHRKRSPAELQLIDDLTNRDCEMVRQRYLDQTAP